VDIITYGGIDYFHQSSKQGRCFRRCGFTGFETRSIHGRVARYFGCNYWADDWKQDSQRENFPWTVLIIVLAINNGENHLPWRY